jgi:hypothetical protein
LASYELCIVTQGIINFDLEICHNASRS